MKSSMPIKAFKFNKYRHKSKPWITKCLTKSLGTKDKQYTQYLKCKYQILKAERRN